MRDGELDNDATRAVATIEEQLRVRGWAAHVTLSGLLGTWESLGASINQYDDVIEEYLNDVTSRDALKVVMDELAPVAIRNELQERVQRADETFLQNTQADEAQELRRFFRITDDDAWWWHRIPTSGPLLAEIRPT